MSTDDVNIIPEFPIAKTTFPSNLSFGGVVDLLLTTLPSRLSPSRPDVRLSLRESRGIDGPMTSNSFEAKRDNVPVRAAIPQAVIAVASHATWHTCVKRLYDERRAVDLFFVYSVNDSGLGGRVACSDEFPLGQQLEGLPLILGPLTDWVDNANAYNIKSSSRRNDDGYRVNLPLYSATCQRFNKLR